MTIPEVSGLGGPGFMFICGPAAKPPVVHFLDDDESGRPMCRQRGNVITSDGSGDENNPDVTCKRCLVISDKEWM